jgi:anti-sigma regulatory factor (Ser/Thr protein kinase)
MTPPPRPASDPTRSGRGAVDRGEGDDRAGHGASGDPLAPGPDGFDLTVPARAEHLKLIRASVTEGALIAGLSSSAAADLVRAVDEACQNIIRHGYKQQPGGQIRIVLAREPDCVSVSLIDSAPQIPPETIRPQPIERPETGGMGTHVIHACVDAVEVNPCHETGGNRLRLTKHVDRAGDAS